MGLLNHEKMDKQWGISQQSWPVYVSMCLCVYDGTQTPKHLPVDRQAQTQP